MSCQEGAPERGRPLSFGGSGRVARYRWSGQVVQSKLGSELAQEDLVVARRVRHELDRRAAGEHAHRVLATYRHGDGHALLMKWFLPRRAESEPPIGIAVHPEKVDVEARHPRRGR